METLLLSLMPSRRFPVVIRYLLSGLIVLLAFAMRLALQGPLSSYPVLLFIPAVFVSGVIFGRGSGFFATALSCVLALYLVKPAWTFPQVIEDLLPIILFALICLSITVVTEALRLSLERTRRAEREKTLLLQEIAHRTKNNLQIISSLLSLQARSQTDPAARAAFEASIARVNVIAQAHDRLQQDDGGSAIDMREYLTGLCDALGDSLRDLRPVAVRADVEAVEIGPDFAVPVGLVVNELVTNAFKYAFPGGRGGAIDVRFRRIADDRAELVVEDDGVGCGEAGDGLGSRLTRLLVEQFNGQIHRSARPDGSGCRITAEMSMTKEG